MKTSLPSTPTSKALARLSGGKLALFEHRKRHCGQTFRSIMEATPAVRSKLAGLADEDGRPALWAPADDAACIEAFRTFSAALGDRPPARFPPLPPGHPLGGTPLAEMIAQDDPLTGHCDGCISDLNAGDLSPGEADTGLETLLRHVKGFGTDGAAKMLAAREPVEKAATPEEVAERLRRRAEYEAAEEAEWAALFPSGYWSDDTDPEPSDRASTPPAAPMDAGQSESGEAVPESHGGGSTPAATTTGASHAEVEPAAATGSAPEPPAGGDSTPVSAGAGAGLAGAQASPSAQAPIRLPELIDAADYALTEPLAPDPIVAGVFERGDKVALLGASKTKKSFYLLELAVRLVTGQPFLGFEVPQAARVLFVNLEIKPGHFHRRVYRVARALGIDPETLRGRLCIMHGRGAGMGWREIVAYAQGVATGWADVVVFDPLYKLVDGEENSAKDMKPVLAAFDKLATETGAAVIYSHHDAKGSPGDRDIRDRGAGSNVTARDYDAGFTLTRHRDDPDAIVVEVLCRNYASPGPLVVRFEDYRFELARDLQPDAATSRNSQSQANQGDSWIRHKESAVALALSKVWLRGEFQEELARRYRLSEVQTGSLFKAVRDDRRVLSLRGPNRGTTPRHFMGPQDAVEREVERLKREAGSLRQRPLPETATGEEGTR